VSVTRVLVLVDGIHTRDVLDAVRRRVADDSLELVLAYVRGGRGRAGLELMRRRPLPPHLAEEVGAAEAAGGRAALDEAIGLAAFAAEVTTLELEGEPGRAVCEAAARAGADLVAVRAAGGPDGHETGPKSLGPTARFIADHSPCPVLLLRGRL
jgi:nucleotide-binding universal stress UspA family protein